MGKALKYIRMRAFLGYTNYYSSYIPNYATYVHKLQDKLKVGRQEGKKGIKKAISWDEEDEKLFVDLKKVFVQPWHCST